MGKMLIFTDPPQPPKGVCFCTPMKMLTFMDGPLLDSVHSCTMFTILTVNIVQQKNIYDR